MTVFARPRLQDNPAHAGSVWTGQESREGASKIHPLPVRAIAAPTGARGFLLGQAEKGQAASDRYGYHDAKRLQGKR